MGRHSTLETQRLVENPECRKLDGAGVGSSIDFSVYGFSGRNVTDRSHTIFHSPDSAKACTCATLIASLGNGGPELPGAVSRIGI